MINAIADFLLLFEDATPAEARTPQRLAELLDKLLVAYHESADAAPVTDSLPPAGDFKSDRCLVRTCFPNLDLYAWTAPENAQTSNAMMGDAVDDLADIYADLRGVAWLLENASPADAVWQFRFGYQSHWGRHLLNLRSYLHWKLYEA